MNIVALRKKRGRARDGGGGTKQFPAGRTPDWFPMKGKTPQEVVEKRGTSEKEGGDPT